MKAKVLIGIWGLLVAASVSFSLGQWPIGDIGIAALAQEFQTVTLKIEGMTCGACVKDVRAALQKVDGVKAIDVHVRTKWFFFSDYSDARAIVTFDPEKAGPEALRKAVESASTALSAYKARLIQDK